jgi:hypothetical protein
MADFSTAIIIILNTIGFILLFITSLLTSWEGLGVIILLFILLFAKNQQSLKVGNKEMIYYVLIYFILWEGAGFLMGRTGTVLSSIFGKLLVLAGILLAIGVVFYLKSDLLNFQSKEA